MVWYSFCLAQPHLYALHKMFLRVIFYCTRIVVQKSSSNSAWLPKLCAKEFPEVQFLVSSFAFWPGWYYLRVGNEVALRVMSSSLVCGRFASDAVFYVLHPRRAEGLVYNVGCHAGFPGCHLINAASNPDYTNTEVGGIVDRRLAYLQSG